MAHFHKLEWESCLWFFSQVCRNKGLWSSTRTCTKKNVDCLSLVLADSARSFGGLKWVHGIGLGNPVVPFQQKFPVYECDVTNFSIGLPESEADKKSDSDSQCCWESDSTQKPPTPYDSDSATPLLNFSQGPHITLIRPWTEMTRCTFETVCYEGTCVARLTTRRADLNPMQPMQLHWSPRLWGPAPWCLVRLFIFSRYPLRSKIQ